jgi:hypothetical protein
LASAAAYELKQSAQSPRVPPRFRQSSQVTVKQPKPRITTEKLKVAALQEDSTFLQVNGSESSRVMWTS